jgi:hypothetical protein
MDVAGLVRGCERCLEELEVLGPEGVRRFDRSKIPRIVVA